MALTEAWLKANNGKVREKVEEVADRDSMSVRVSAKGKIVFQLRYRFAGKPVRHDIGTYPFISLKDARIESERLRAMLDQGKNPKIEVMLEREVHTKPISVNDIFDRWYESYCLTNKKRHDQVLGMYNRHVKENIGKLPADRLDTSAWLDFFDVHAKQRPGVAKNLLANIKQMLKWAAKRKYIKTNVLSDINPREDLGITRNVGKRVLSDDEIKIFYECMKYSRIKEKNKIFMQLCLIYGCRNGELRIAKKTDFDFINKIWTVPADNHKTGHHSNEPILRPIVAATEVLIKELFELNKGEYAFVSGSAIENMTESSAAALPSSVLGWVKRFKKTEMKHWSLHDLRRTARTNFSKISKDRDLHELMIGHVLPNDQSTYDLYEYLREQAEIYNKWIEKLETLKING
ncbi:tyrosine-type recombinase/integrase [Acinetobacter ursingii]|uniref:tyrosine-type recombinase/integrase n=1 Tax=Acinetobacter ursingii TaxID=108980 RepID=UPI0021CD3F65|nr:integrase family protein [Acinetobacter ursingii]MCU4496338.1 integrase family protein [Acinetobacter ursingii]UYF78269.1 integrase family protein [Acinetobacter ursingii]